MKPLLEGERTRAKLRALTSDIRSRRGKLYTTIRNAIIDWEGRWRPKKYPQSGVLLEGDVLTEKERTDLAADIQLAVRDVVW